MIGLPWLAALEKTSVVALEVAITALVFELAVLLLEAALVVVLEVAVAAWPWFWAEEEAAFDSVVVSWLPLSVAAGVSAVLPASALALLSSVCLVLSVPAAFSAVFVCVWAACSLAVVVSAFTWLPAPLAQNIVIPRSTDVIPTLSFLKDHLCFSLDGSFIIFFLEFILWCVS